MDSGLCSQGQGIQEVPAAQSQAGAGGHGAMLLYWGGGGQRNYCPLREQVSAGRAQLGRELGADETQRKYSAKEQEGSGLGWDWLWVAGTMLQELRLLCTRPVE